MIIKLTKTAAMIADGHGELNAVIDDEMWPDVKGHTWKLVYRWGKRNKAFAAQTRIDGRVVQLHRLVTNMHEEMGKGWFVIPRDKNALNCVESNLQCLTKEAFEAQRGNKPKKERVRLNSEQQAWLDARALRLGQSRWYVFREAVQCMMDHEARAGIEPDPFS